MVMSRIKVIIDNLVHKNVYFAIKVQDTLIDKVYHRIMGVGEDRKNREEV